MRDKIAVCRFYGKRMQMFDQFGYYCEESGPERMSESVSASETKQKEGPPDLDLGNYQTEQAMLNNLESSLSIKEKTAKKLLPIFKSLLFKIQQLEAQMPLDSTDAKASARISQERLASGNERGRGQQPSETGLDGSDSSGDDLDIKKSARDKSGGRAVRPKSSKNTRIHPIVKGTVTNVDLRHILGFLNQTEWIQNLNIGNIMQISALKAEEMAQVRRNEEALTRESFLDLISFLIVGYFCASTEIRFIIQLKDELGKFKNFSVEQRTHESEVWHTMSLDIACSFLPSDCPLLNHILLSY